MTKSKRLKCLVKLGRCGTWGAPSYDDCIGLIVFVCHLVVNANDDDIMIMIAASVDVSPKH